MHEKVGKLRKTQTEESTVIQQTTPNAIILGPSQETETDKMLELVQEH